MQINNLDEEYLTIVKNILNNENFNSLKNCEHHGITRFDHAVKVSYQAYKYAKKHNLNYENIAIGGLLHDFFLTENMSSIEKFKSTFTHSKLALENSNNIFDINDVQKNIIECHMFPLSLKLPKYKESWIVSLFDKKVALFEFTNQFQYQIRYAVNLGMILLLNFMK